MKRGLCFAVIFGIFVYLMPGCGGDDGGTGPEIVTVDSIYVDVHSFGTPDGTSASPYNTLTEAISVAAAGDVLIILAGEYDGAETFPIDLKPELTLQGEDATTTLIRGSIRDMNVDDSRAVVLKDLSCEGFTFGRNAAPGTPTDVNIIKRCIIQGDVEIAHGGGHSFTVDSCGVTGDVTFGHGSGDCRDAIRWSTVDGTVSFSSAEAATTDGLVQVIIECEVDEGIFFNSGAGAADTIIECDIDSVGISYKSGNANAYIAYNTIDNGRIIDKSGSGDQYIVHNNITCKALGLEEDSACVFASGASDIVTHNTISALFGADGIVARSGYPTIIDSNSINVSGGGQCIFTESAAGQVVGNSVTGGAVGLTDSSGALLVAFNQISRCGTGTIVSSAARYLHNTISECTMDGMIIEYSGQAIDSNTVIDNSGAGIRILEADTDFGGGPYSGFGGNTITGNTAWDFVNESADTVWAKFNFWDHADSGSVDASDIYDKEENASSGPVIFMPLGQ
jgi:hypothetical protein